MKTTWATLSASGMYNEREGKATLHDYQVAVDGYIECVDTNPLFSMYVNEEGLLKGLPRNLIASVLSTAFIVGDVAIVGKADRFGNTKPLSAPALRFLRNMFNEEHCDKASEPCE